MNAIHTNLFELVQGLSEAIDLISPMVANHHKRVGYIAAAIAAEGKITASRCDDILHAALLHDVGALSMQERERITLFLAEKTDAHCEIGYLLLKKFERFQTVADLVRFHHLPWNHGKGLQYGSIAVLPEAHLLHLADRIAVLIDPKVEILQQVEKIVGLIQTCSGTIFNPEYIEWFLKLTKREFFWFEATLPVPDTAIARFSSRTPVQMDLDDAISLSNIFAHIIDFKSSFTATHSAGVGTVAKQLAQRLMLPEPMSKTIQLAGYLHDIGKLAVPTDIIEKPGPLTEHEFNLMRKHTFYTDYILNKIPGFEELKPIASLHHEHINGHGYPFHLAEKELSVETRIVAVADVFTALAEERPYRAPMAKPQTIFILKQMVKTEKLDPNIVNALEVHYEEIDGVREVAQKEAKTLYERMLKEVVARENSLT